MPGSPYSREKTMSTEIYKIGRKISGITIFGFWLLVLVLPTVVMNVALERLFEFTLKRNTEAQKHRLINEMEIFRRDVDVENFLQKISSRYLDEKRLTINSLSASDLAHGFKQRFEIDVDAVIVNRKNKNDDKDFYFSSTFLERAGFIGKTFTRKYLQSRVLPQISRTSKFLNADEAERLKIENQIKKQVLESDLFWQKQFGLIATLPMIPGRVFSSISSKMMSRMFFYLHELEESHLQIMMIFRASEIGPFTMMKNTLTPSDQALKRTFTRRVAELDDRESVNKAILTRFVEDENGISLVSTLPQTTLAHTVQAGRFFPVLLDSFRKNLPMLKVSISADDLQHSLKKYSPLIYKSSRILCFLSLVCCLHIYLFGFQLKAGIRTKAIVGIVLITLLPLAMLVASYFTWREIEERNTALDIETTLSQSANDYLLQFDAFLVEHQKETLQIVDEIESLDRQIPEKVALVLKRHLRNSLAREAFFDSTGRESVYERNSQAFYDHVNDREENFFRRVLAGLLLQAATFEQKMYPASLGNYEENGLYRPEPKLVNNILNNRGRLISFKAFNTNYVYSTASVSERQRASKTRFLTLRFDKRMLVKEFVNRVSKQGKKHSLNDVFFLGYEQQLGKFEVKILGKKVDFNGPEEMLELAAAEKRSIFVERNGRKLFISVVPGYPLLLVCQADFRNNHLHGQVFLVFFIYVLLLNYLIYRLFGLLYVAPVLDLAKAALKVAEGDYSARVSVPSGDEIYDLKYAFDSMVQGVAQKETMFKFVSEDVRNAVISNDESSLRPGGEKVEATIAFVSISGFEDLLDKCDSEELINQLEIFIATGNDIALQNGGVLDKVIENTLMLVFRNDKTGKSHASKACRTVLQIQKALEMHGVYTQAGIATGTVISGKIGSNAGKLDFTVIGDAVNLAARLKGQAEKAVATGVVVSASTIRSAGGSIRVKFLDLVNLKGKSREYQLYELLALRE